MDVYARFFPLGTDGQRSEWPPESKLNDLRHLALFGAVAAANAETVVRTRRRHRGARHRSAHELQLGSCLLAQP